MFEWNYTFTALRNPQSEAAWSSLMPVRSISCPKVYITLAHSNLQFGRGYVFVKDPAKYEHISPGESSPNGEIYSVALYHQLHCLSIIRRDYFNLLEGVWHNKNDTELREEVHSQIENSHNRHCLDYIRQTLECNADMTIEWERTEKDGRRFQVDGMHIPHECKRKVRKHTNPIQPV